MSDFITKDSGERQDYDSGMRRDTTHDKPRFGDLIIDGIPYEEQLLTRYAMLRTRGAVKYGPRNCELANSQEEADRFKDSAFRHFMQWYTGELDEDHAAATLFNIQLAEMVKYRVDNPLDNN